MKISLAKKFSTRFSIIIKYLTILRGYVVKNVSGMNNDIRCRFNVLREHGFYIERLKEVVYFYKT